MCMKKIWNTDVTKDKVGEVVTVYGWVQRKRDLGGLLFIDLRDRSGLVQLVLHPDNACYDKALNVKNEYVLCVTGEVVLREQANTELKTGEVEVEVQDFEVLNSSLEVPFAISNETTALEDTRLKYRYLDLRRSVLKDKLEVRYRITRAIRRFLDSKDFLEIETPVLCKSTPEGARDYLVPSRVNPGTFYALPQSPQLFKQLLMVGGMERYFEIAKCFRDED